MRSCFQRKELEVIYNHTTHLYKRKNPHVLHLPSFHFSIPHSSINNNISQSKDNMGFESPYPYNHKEDKMLLTDHIERGPMRGKNMGKTMM